MKIFTFLLFTIFTFQLLNAQSVDTISIYSPSMSKEIKCVIVKPDNYDKKNIKFPVVYLLHGYSESYSYWIK